MAFSGFSVYPLRNALEWKCAGYSSGSGSESRYIVLYKLVTVNKLTAASLYGVGQRRSHEAG